MAKCKASTGSAVKGLTVIVIYCYCSILLCQFCEMLVLLYTHRVLTVNEL